MEPLLIKYPNYNAHFAEMHKSLYENSSFADLIFICDDNIHIKAHKLLVSSVSDFMKVAIISSGRKNVYVSLPNVNSELLTVLLRFLYTGNADLKTAEFGDFRKLLQLLGIHHNFKNAISGNLSELCFELKKYEIKHSSSSMRLCSITEVKENTLEMCKQDNTAAVIPEWIQWLPKERQLFFTQINTLESSPPFLLLQKPADQSSYVVPQIYSTCYDRRTSDVESLTSHTRSSLPDSGSSLPDTSSSSPSIGPDDCFRPSFFTAIHSEFQTLISPDTDTVTIHERQIQLGDARNPTKIKKCENEEGISQENEDKEEFSNTSSAYLSIETATNSAADTMETPKNLHEDQDDVHEYSSLPEYSKLETDFVTPEALTDVGLITESKQILVDSRESISGEIFVYESNLNEKSGNENSVDKSPEQQKMENLQPLNDQLSPKNNIKKCDNKVPDSPVLAFILPPKKRKVVYDETIEDDKLNVAKLIPVVNLKRISLADIQRLENCSSIEGNNQPNRSGVKEECLVLGMLKEDYNIYSDSMYEVFKSEDDEDDFPGFDESVNFANAPENDRTNYKSATENKISDNKSFLKDSMINDNSPSETDKKDKSLQESDIKLPVLSMKTNEIPLPKNGVPKARKRIKGKPLGDSTAPIINKKRKAKTERNWKLCCNDGKNCH